ncbi:DUF2306 domain-containing protein [Dactylosporangium fulvum]
MPVALVVLAAVPVIAGGARVGQLAGGAEVTPENARFFAMPVPVLVHIFSVTVYALLGAFQFHAGLRRRHPARHRAAGRVLVVAGLATALSGMWMTVFYPLPANDGDAVNALRLVVGTAMLVSVVLGVAAARRRDFTAHRAWMMRGYALAMGAGTQAFTHAPWVAFFGQPTEAPRFFLMAAGWLINLAVVEWMLLRSRPSSGRVRRGPAAARSWPSR